MSDGPAGPRTHDLRPDEPARVLAANFDTIYSSYEVVWQDENFLIYLGDLHAKAQASGQPQPGEIRLADGSDTFRFNVLPHGSRGYSFVLESREMTWKVSASLEPGGRPNVLVEIRSEALWHLSPPVCLARIIILIEGANGSIRIAKSSRVDACVDVLVRDCDFTEHLRPLIVTRARDVEPKFPNRKFSGFTIGHGQIKARFYDKPMEIRRKNKKFWMFPIWGLEVGHVPKGHRIIRFEFELHRERLKSLGVETLDDLFRMQNELWAYCTQRWLKIMDCPEKQSHRRKLLPLWKVVQAGFKGAETAHPLVRAMAVSQDKKQSYQQIMGHLIRMCAIDINRDQLHDGAGIVLSDYFPALERAAEELGIDPIELADRVRQRQAKFERASDSYLIALALRKELQDQRDKEKEQPTPQDDPREPPH
jgi:hypothetical protein